MQHEEGRGIALAVAGFALLSVGDAVIKTMAGQWSPLGVATLRFVIAAVGLSALLVRSEGAAALRPGRPLLQAARGASLALSTICFVSALFILPLAETAALVFISPVMTALLSGPLLGERVRREVWIASMIALCGVAVVLRPDLAALGWVALLPLGAALFFSLTVIANRASAGQGSALAMQAYLALFATPVLLAAIAVAALFDLASLVPGVPHWSVAARCAIVALTASVAHWLIYQGTLRAGAATIAPTGYVQLPVAGFFGWWWFGDLPDGWTLLGAAIIIGAGLYLWRTSQSPRQTIRGD